MLPSRFSIRTLLAVVTGCAIVFAVVAQALRGSGWAIAFSATFASVLLIIAIHFLFFVSAVVVNMFGSLFRSRAPATQSPFAQDRPPPQWIEPSEPES
ncbi:MAG: hypothetical protein U0935_21580 [Pirellulales bacterium]